MEHMFVAKCERSTQIMSDTEKLISYILTLTPEQADKIIRQMPRLIALREESSQPCPPEQSLQTQ